MKMTTDEIIDAASRDTGQQSKIDDALTLILRYGQIDGDHHKMWTIDQVVRILTGERYEAFVKAACDGEDGSESYYWDVGTPP